MIPPFPYHAAVDADDGRNRRMFPVLYDSETVRVFPVPLPAVRATELVPMIPPEPTYAALVLTATLLQVLEMFSVPPVAPPTIPPASTWPEVADWFMKPVAQTCETVQVPELQPFPASEPSRCPRFATLDEMFTFVKPMLRTVAPERVSKKP